VDRITLAAGFMQAHDVFEKGEAFIEFGREQFDVADVSDVSECRLVGHISSYAFPD
jgi:hypothetical protein